MAARVAGRAIISIVILPAICAIGLGLGASDWNLASGAALTLLTHVVTIVVVGTLAFMACGYGSVEGAVLETEFFHTHRQARFIRFGAARLAAFFDRRRGPLIRILMPLVLLGLVYFPLRGALDDVAWEYRVRAAIRASIAREPRRVMQTRVRVDKGAVETVVVLLGNTQDAELTRARLDADVRLVAGLVPHVEVFAIPDAHAFAGLQASVEAPVAVAPSTAPPIRPLDAARAEVESVVERVWPSSTAGRPLLVEFGLEDTLRVTHIGPSLDAVARESIERALDQAWSRKVALLDVAVPEQAMQAILAPPARVETRPGPAWRVQFVAGPCPAPAAPASGAPSGPPSKAP